MFKETTANTQMSLFDNPADLMGKRAVKKYEDPNAWFNQFYALVTSQIDESVFRPLLKEGNMGAPTASIRQLVAMSILKEGFGCSDEDLIEKCDYDLLTRKALGLVRMEDEAPSLDTYYLLRRRICDYADATGENLMETCFSRLTGFQAANFKISGKYIRMDSKLIGSNIAWYPRYELIHKTFLREMGQYMSRLNPSLRKKVQPWLEENAKQTVYMSNSETIKQRLAELGRVIYAVLVRVKFQDGLLKQVFEEQYVVEHGQVTPRDKKSIAADDTREPSDVAGEVTIVEGVDMAAPVEELPPIDPKQDIENFRFPLVDLLSDYADKISEVSRSELETNIQRIRTTLESFRIGVDSVRAIVGPAVTLYKVKLAPGVKCARVKNVENDIGMALNNSPVRVTILSDSVGIEVANDTRSIVPLKALFKDRSFRESKAELPVAIGYTFTKQVKTFDLADAPHLLVAGATKQDKSVGLNVIVTSLLYSKLPSELKFVFIDPKRVEFTPYKKLIKHYLATMPTAVSESEEEDSVIVKKHDKADEILRSLCLEMDERYELMSLADTNKVTDYNAKYRARRLRQDQGLRYLPYLVVVIDEYSDLIMSGGADQKSMSRSVMTSIIRLTHKGRDAGIHVILATQRPTVDVITGLIKANFPTRIAFKVVSRKDSATILDTPGAEKLIGRGDMLYYKGYRLERVQCAYVDPQETERLTKFIAEQKGFRQHYEAPYYLPELPAGSSEPSSSASIGKLDPNFDEVARLVVTNQRASTTDVQKRMGMGFARASRVMGQLQAAGIVGPPDGAKPRQILVQSLDELDDLLANLDNR